jgi:hypothetical protein
LRRKRSLVGPEVCLPFERSFALKLNDNRALFNRETCCVSIARLVFQLHDTPKRFDRKVVDRVNLATIPRKNFSLPSIFFHQVAHSILKATTAGRTKG